MPASQTDYTVEALKILASGVVGALAAYLFNLFHWKTTEKLRKLELISQSIIDNTIKIEGTAIDYWLSRSAQNEQEKLRLKHLEITIKSLLLTQNSSITKLISISRSKQQSEIAEIIKKMNNRLYDLATGEEFESALKPSRPSKCNRISKACAEIRFKLIELSI